jgi:hypothetical protein
MTTGKNPLGRAMAVLILMVAILCRAKYSASIRIHSDLDVCSAACRLISSKSGCIGSRNLNFVTRGVGISAISVILMFAVCSLQPIRSLDAHCTLSQMIELAIERAQKNACID